MTDNLETETTGVSAPVARRLEEALRQRISELEKKVAKLELSLLNVAALHADTWRFKTQTRNVNVENTIPKTTKLC